jgi:hypothetical protein
VLPGCQGARCCCWDCCCGCVRWQVSITTMRPCCMDARTSGCCCCSACGSASRKRCGLCGRCSTAAPGTRHCSLTPQGAATQPAASQAPLAAGAGFNGSAAPPSALPAVAAGAGCLQVAPRLTPMRGLRQASGPPPALVLLVP